jgi:hypothetical protein
MLKTSGKGRRKRDRGRVLTLTITFQKVLSLLFFVHLLIPSVGLLLGASTCATSLTTLTRTLGVI